MTEKKLADIAAAQTNDGFSSYRCCAIHPCAFSAFNVQNDDFHEDDKI